MKARTLLILAVAVGVVLLSSSSAQIQANGECVQAKTWHLQQAMKLTLQKQQDFHLGAADAADKLSTMGGTPCAGWKDWANGRAGPVDP
jgi:hypothetical protein